jgi:hypothetical protein
MKRTVYRVLGYLTLGLVAIVVALGLLLTAAHYAFRQEPAFYREAMQAGQELQADDGEQLARRVLQLHNDTRQAGGWEASFSAEQINSWLATDLQEKFPNVVPPQFQNPRLAIEQNLVRLACWYNDPPTNTILSLDLDLHLTDEPNVIAIHIHKARAGVVPVPLVQVFNTVSDFARRANIELSWANMSTDPVALVTIPSHREQWTQLLHLEALEVRDGEIYLSGRTEPETPKVDSRPSAAIRHATLRNPSS